MQLSFLTVLYSVGALLLICVPGYIFRKLNIIKAGGARALVTVLIYLAQPAVLVMSFQDKVYTPDVLPSLLQVAVFAVVIHFVMIGLAWAVMRGFSFEKRRRGAYIFASAFANCGFMGIPFITMLFQEPIRGELLILLSEFIAVFNIVNWTVGIYLISGDKKNISVFRALVNPATVALAIGLPLFFLGVQLKTFAEPLANVLDLTGKMTTPLAMVILGIKLAEMPIRKIFTSAPVYVVSALKLLVMPFIMLLILMPFGDMISEPVRALLVIISAMPAATTTLANAEQFGGDVEEAAKCLLCTTVLCIITIPVMCLLI